MRMRTIRHYDIPYIDAETDGGDGGDKSERRLSNGYGLHAEKYGTIVPEFYVYHRPAVQPIKKYIIDAYFNATTAVGFLYVMCYLSCGILIASGVEAAVLVIKYDNDILPYGADLYKNAEVIMTVLLIAGSVGLMSLIYSMAVSDVYTKRMCFGLAVLIIVIPGFIVSVLNIVISIDLNRDACKDEVMAWRAVNGSFVSLAYHTAGCIIPIGIVIVILVYTIAIAIIRAKNNRNADLLAY